ncbi:ferredoxin [Arthrobacter sp. B2a2-09]|uniref:ferredoxin n=1 Tax=Arthrobacter sp. B2a2-09 TaxID=2952822 RepID=UPI0022CD2B23|nr:ferredoxin [Arthrobacter sp. B2a2-09]MCZ9881982.1 ferredoxin [Arthrobacter sp. B2a2-09]
MQINANRATCIGSGQCVFTDPDAFDQDDDGTVLILRAEPVTNEEITRANQAVHVCPSRSLSLVTEELEYS